MHSALLLGLVALYFEFEADQALHEEHAAAGLTSNLRTAISLCTPPTDCSQQQLLGTFCKARAFLLKLQIMTQ